jgi:vacuolar-type H+-ATPase subunit I/STV1
MSEPIVSLQVVREELLDYIKHKELQLNSAEIQLAFERETDPAKKSSFILERQQFTVYRVKLENAILEKIASQLNSLKPDLQEGLENLDVALQDVNNTVAILNTVKLVTGIVAQIVKFA